MLFLVLHWGHFQLFPSVTSFLGLSTISIPHLVSYIHSNQSMSPIHIFLFTHRTQFLLCASNPWLLIKVIMPSVPPKMTGPNSSKDMFAWSLADPSLIPRESRENPALILNIGPPMLCVAKASPTYLGSRLLHIRRWLQGEQLERMEGTEPHPRVKVIARPRPRSTWLPVPRPLSFAEGPFFVLDPINGN